MADQELKKSSGSGASENSIMPTQQGGLVEAVTHGELDGLIKPLVREIHLFDSYIAGTTHLQDPSVLDEITVGEKLSLRREQNKFDVNAIMVLKSDGRKLGYIPEKDNIVFARLMDAGKLLTAKIVSMEAKGSFRMIRIGIYLVDF